MKLIALFARRTEIGRRVTEQRAALYRVAFAWCHDATLADDLVQETLCKALDRAAQLREAARLRPWLFAILANCWRDHLRRRRPDQDVDELDEAVLIDAFTPEDAHHRLRTVFRVRHAVARLPLGQREVVTLVDLEGMSYADVSAALSIPIGTVMSRLCRARAALREQLRPEASALARLRSIK